MRIALRHPTAGRAGPTGRLSGPDTFDPPPAARVQILHTCSRRRPAGAARRCARCSRKRSRGACGLPAGPRAARGCGFAAAATRLRTRRIDLDRFRMRGRRPPPLNGAVPAPQYCFHRLGLNVTRHHRGFTGVHPSGLPLACGPRAEQGPLGFSPRLRTPPSPATHARVGTGHGHWPGTTQPTRPTVGPPSCESTHNVRPRVAPPRCWWWSRTSAAATTSPMRQGQPRQRRKALKVVLSRELGPAKK